jgi:hypothetical protein
MKNKLTPILNSVKVAAHTESNKQIMRTKTLLLTAALSVATVATSMADVFSVNVVGYVNVVVPPGLSMIANPLLGTNNTVGSLFSSVPEGTTLYKFGPSGYSINQFFGPGDGWANPADSFQPGEGAFISNPTAASFTNTFVGEVALNSTNSLPQGLSIRGSVLPIASALQSSLGFPASEGDLVYTFVNGNYQIFQYFGPEDGWSAEPANTVGGAFWVNKANSTNWVQSFTVTP